MAPPLKRASDVLAPAPDLLAQQLAALAAVLDVAEPLAPVWKEYRETAVALKALLPAGRLMSTREYAEKLGVDVKTVLRRRKAGLVTPVSSPKAGKRGAAAMATWCRPQRSPKSWRRTRCRHFSR